jgi:hypothetical protein
MCDEFDQNRRALMDLIYSKNEFTESEIIAEYKEKRGFFIVDAVQSISGYLRDLREMGILSYSQGRYHVK